MMKTLYKPRLTIEKIRWTHCAY